MRNLFLCSLLLFGVPQIAVAAGAMGPFLETMSGDSQGLERTAAPVTFAQRFDLQIEGQTRVAQVSPDDAGGNAARRSERQTGTYDASSDRGLSLGLEIRPRTRFGALARQDDTEDPSLGDQLQRLIERPVFGLRGRYRF